MQKLMLLILEFVAIFCGYDILNHRYEKQQEQDDFYNVNYLKQNGTISN